MTSGTVRLGDTRKTFVPYYSETGQLLSLLELLRVRKMNKQYKYERRSRMDLWIKV